MNFKNLFVAGIAGGIVYYILGWLFYGLLFFDFFGGQEPANMLFIGLGCLSVGFLLAYVFVRWGQIGTLTTGLKGGIGIGLILGFMNNFFANSMTTTPNYERIAMDIVITIISCGIAGGIVGVVNGKMK